MQVLEMMQKNAGILGILLLVLHLGAVKAFGPAPSEEGSGPPPPPSVNDLIISGARACCKRTLTRCWAIVEAEPGSLGSLAGWGLRLFF